MLNYASKMMLDGNFSMTGELGNFCIKEGYQTKYNVKLGDSVISWQPFDLFWCFRMLKEPKVCQICFSAIWQL